jgi:hypothetical protein
MFGEQQTRTLLGPADPARTMTVAPPRLSAYDLIARAEATAAPRAARRNPRPTRRLVLTTGAVAVAAAATTAVTSTLDRPNGTARTAQGTVLVPITYQFATAAPPAGPRLRALASRIGDAPYEYHTGRYTYHHYRSWGGGMMGSADGHTVSLSEEWKVWQAADGSGRQVTIFHEPQYPDQESRDYWERYTRATPIPALDPASRPQVMQLWPTGMAPLPADRAGLVEMLKVQYGSGPVCKEAGTIYGRYAVPLRARAEILRILADVPGLRWRGKVTDRAGRPGLAVTFDDREHDTQFLLIFNAQTGELLAEEIVSLSPTRMTAYRVFLGTDRTDNLG